MTKTGVLQAIRERRSVRRYKPDDVSDSDLNIVLEAARWAASWANTQCWEFVVVRDKELKAKLSNTLSINNPASLAIRQAPVVIVACAHREKSGYYKGKPVTDKGDWFMFDMALAMQNLALAAYALGLGTVHVGYFDAQKVADVIDIPEEMTVVELMPLGYPDEEPKAPPRKELSEILSYDKFGEKK